MLEEGVVELGGDGEGEGREGGRRSGKSRLNSRI